ncbi:MAG: hypothetical protein A3C90_02115 [Candidatus Magasanikbacteria bacterium RIFCSPHIGHO2_02_FULL_51_14]|uniref:Uncharacterized protein n=1 Tax=Candidatus Magasanikbacteria bacterium RIFCSPHIGHO2_02_FULL_51_14 TaxID=1798683 RepID=A0A1F6MQB6_9BACT|nr:MAG: hypothetical protein A3C90_02115 [Candidatus Magasanikbacteria bacterium RIFCSPHIGHO2_02_FULL_51_14]
MNFFVYHKVPDNLKGDILLPLNVLQKKFPQIYKQEIRKYRGREILLKKKIPFLQCLWSDVLHFSCVHPQKIFNALKRVGFQYSGDAYYKVNIHTLNPKLWVFFLHEIKGKEIFSQTVPNYKKIQRVSNQTIKYYKECFKENKHPLLYAGIPHLLFKGPLNVNNYEIIDAE